MDNSELVSVIVPTYNRAFCIEGALNSVRDQVYRPIELVVIDDGSEDDTVGIVERWKLQNEDADFVVKNLSQSNCGAPRARNAGFDLSSGLYIQFLDSDDKLSHKKITKQVEHIKLYKVDYVWSWWHVVSDGREEVMRVGKKSYVPSSVAIGLFRREAVESVGPWNEKLPFAQDWNYVVRLLSTDREVGHLDDVLYEVQNEDMASITAARNQDPESYKLNLLVLKETVRQIEHVSGPSARLICARALMTMRLSAAKKDPLTFAQARDIYLRHIRKAGGASNWVKGMAVARLGGALYRAWSSPGRS